MATFGPERTLDALSAPVKTGLLELEIHSREGWSLHTFRLLTLIVAYVLYAGQSYACQRQQNFGAADFIFADVVIEARVVGYRTDPQNNIAFLDLETIKTLIGFEKERWTADLRPFTSSVPKANIWDSPVLIPLRGRITETGEFTATVIDKHCALLAIFPTDREPGISLKANLEPMFRK
ncbi:hypothetical protein [Ensifer sp. Root127]|uniref:hypothetical protein n=1 Tax=Ensifer sp. Root127 TaxID=1736440 RepID=UPI0007141588|nr:hypothetical protein [Ensifer sp. Root127]KQW76766.1 hypothetical protein ASD03_27340 [Ensifer sp. Root127]